MLFAMCYHVLPWFLLLTKMYTKHVFHAEAQITLFCLCANSAELSGLSRKGRGHLSDEYQHFSLVKKERNAPWKNRSDRLNSLLQYSVQVQFSVFYKTIQRFRHHFSGTEQKSEHPDHCCAIAAEHVRAGASPAAACFKPRLFRTCSVACIMCIMQRIQQLRYLLYTAQK